MTLILPPLLKIVVELTENSITYPVKNAVKNYPLI